MDSEDISSWVRGKLAQNLIPTLVGLSRDHYKNQTDVALHDVKKMCRERGEYELYETDTKVIAIRRIHAGACSDPEEPEEEDESFDEGVDCEGKGEIPSDDGIETEERHTIEFSNGSTINIDKQVLEEGLVAGTLKIEGVTRLPDELQKKIEEHESMVRKMAPKQAKAKKAKKPDGPSSAKRRSYYDLMRKMHPKAKPPKKYGMSDEDYIKWVEGESGYNDVVGAYERAHGITKPVKRIQIDTKPQYNRDDLVWPPINASRGFEENKKAYLNALSERVKELNKSKLSDGYRAPQIREKPNNQGPPFEKVTTKEVLEDVRLIELRGLNFNLIENKGISIALKVLTTNVQDELSKFLVEPQELKHVENALQCIKGVNKLLG